MKKINFITSIAGCMMGLMALCTSCSQDVEDVTTPDVPKEEVIGGMYSVKMNFNVSKTDFDSQGATRYANSKWEDNDVVFIRFISKDSTIVVGNAIYSATNEDWTVNYENVLLRDSLAGCEVYYIEGTKATDEVLRASTISIPDSVGVFCDTTATYKYPTDSSLTVTASLKPLTGRIRFCGEQGDSIVVTGISAYSKFTKSTAAMTKSQGSRIMKVNNNVSSKYYTRYVYGVLTDTTRVMYVENDSIKYKMVCDDKVLKTGKSGWMNIPTERSHNGWVCTQGEMEGHTWVDLGLPSGLKWATTNVGATTPENSGDSYYWGAITTSGSYSSLTTDISGNSQYDAARYNWGGTWRMPTYEEMKELLTYCTIKSDILNGYYGRRFTGPNGESIFIRSGSASTSSLGYWTSTPYSSSSSYKYVNYYSTSYTSGMTYESKSYTNRIRPVTD